MSAPSYDEALAAAPSSANAVQGLQRDITQLAPLATRYASPRAQAPLATFKSSSSSSPDEGAVLNFAHFMGGVATQVGNITQTAAGWVGEQVKSMVTAPIRYGVAEAHGIVDNITLHGIDDQRSQLDGKMQNLIQQYKSGTISKDEYRRHLNDITQDFDNLDRQSHALTNKFGNDYQEAVQATIDTSALLLSIGGGFGGGTTTNVTRTGLVSVEARTAGDFFASSAAKVFFGSTENAIQLVAAHPTVFKLLAPGMRRALETSVAEVVASGAKLSAGQIARAAAVNLAFKYPLTYWWVSGTGTELYHELDNAKYGDAARTAAVNAALLLSGGPIGYALQWGGTVTKAVVDRLFTRSAFIDELSKGIGSGQADGLWKAVNNLEHPEKFKFLQNGQLITLSKEEAQKRLAANLSALEATNMTAAGKDPVAAAWRVLKGMASYEGISMKDFTHEEALINMNNFAEAQRAADEAGKVLNTRITVGRVDARSLNRIAADLTAGDKVAEGLPAEAGAAKTDMTGAPDFLQPETKGATIEAPPNADEKTMAYLKSQAEKLPSGYKVTLGGNDTGVFAPDGHELNTSQLQDITQAPYLTEFEKASREGDTATMQRIAQEHPGDNRVNMGSLHQEPALKTLTEEITGQPVKLPGLSAEAKANLMAKARQEAAQSTNLPAGYLMTNTGVVGPDGKIVKDVQSLAQPSFLTDFEKAHNKGDFTTMAQIISQHQGDTRLDLTGLLSPQDERMLAWEKVKIASPNQAWAHNENFDRQIKSLIKKYDNPDDLTLAISKIKAQTTIDGLPKELADTLSQMGYIPIQPKNLEAPFTEGTGRVASAFAKANSDIFTKTVQPVPVLSWLGGVMSKAGLSPYASSERVYQLFNDNLSRNLQASGVINEIRGESLSESTDSLIKKLSSYMHNPTASGVSSVLSKMPITDLRMLTAKDIAIATGLSRSEAKLVQDAIARSFLQVPLAVRGLGDHAVDLTYGLRGTAAIERRYLRVQGALRFSWNPFFQYLRLVPKTEMLSEFEGGGFISSVFAGRLRQIGEIRAGLREAGFLEEKGALGSVVSGEATDFAGSMGRNLNHKLLPAQEGSIAGLVDAQAQRMGMEWRDYIAAYPDNVRDTIQMIAQYDKRSQILNSPLMRTLNVAFFPLRFDTKVAMIMTRSLAKTSLATQVGVLKGLYSFHDWINSDQGRAWYASNADAIGLFNYVTPLAHLSEIGESLLPGHDHSLGNFGELGGLPFGFITQLFDSEGITHFNQAGINPKTGDIYSQYLPQTARGQITVLIQDMVSSLFSYPGATAGLPSKTKLSRNFATGITGAKSSDFNIVPTPPTPEQLSYQQSLERMGMRNPDPGPLGINAPLLSYDIPQLPTAANVPTPPPLRSGTTSKKQKKSAFRPSLLPGQTTLGQL